MVIYNMMQQTAKTETFCGVQLVAVAKLLIAYYALTICTLRQKKFTRVYVIKGYKLPTLTGPRASVNDR